MTPLTRFLERFLPRALVWPALALIYAGMILAVVVARDAREVIYVDVGGAGER
jgi:hypothetical protein